MVPEVAALQPAALTPGSLGSTRRLGILSTPTLSPHWRVVIPIRKIARTDHRRGDEGTIAGRVPRPHPLSGTRSLQAADHAGHTLSDPEAATGEPTKL